MTSMLKGASTSLSIANSSVGKLEYSPPVFAENGISKENDKVNPDDDDSYEEIVVSDEEEYLEYYEEILDDESEFTEVTCDSGGVDETDRPYSYLPKESDGSPYFPNNLDVDPAAAHLDNSVSSFSIHSESESPFKSQRMSSNRLSTTLRRPVIKTAKEKALEEEKARIVKEETEISNTHKFKLARRDSFCRRDAELQRQLQEEEERHLREEEEEERQRLQEEEKIAKQRAEEAAARIKEQKEAEERIRLEKIEKERLEKEAEERRLEAMRIAEEKAAIEKARRQKEEADRIARDKKKREMEEEVRKLEAELEEKKRLAAETESKRAAEQARLQAKVQARRQAKKETTSNPAADSSISEIPGSTTSTINTTKPVAQSASVDEKSVQTKETNTVSNESAVYYTIDQLRKMTVPGLDYKNREIYLCPQDFQLLFGMPREEFDTQPKWKKTTLKRKAKLF